MYRRTYKLSRKQSGNPNFSSKSPHSLVDIYGKNKELVNEAKEYFENLIKYYDLSYNDLFRLIKDKDKFIPIPISVFRNSLSPLEAITQYLKDALGFNFHKIALLLNRDDRTIWLTYTNAKKKDVELLVTDELFLPIYVFADRKLSVLENISRFLIDIKSYSLAEVSRLLDRDYRTVWTVYNRAKKKYVR